MQTFQITDLVPGPIVAQIGRIAVHWSILELRIEQAIWQLKGVKPKEGRLLTATRNLDHRLKTLKQLARQNLTEDRLEETLDTVKEIKEVGLDRHWAIHGLVGTDLEGGLHSISYRQKPEKGQAKPISNESLRAVRRKIDDVRRRLENAIPLQ